MIYQGKDSFGTNTVLPIEGDGIIDYIYNILWRKNPAFGSSMAYFDC